MSQRSSAPRHDRGAGCVAVKIADGGEAIAEVEALHPQRQARGTATPADGDNLNPSVMALDVNAVIAVVRSAMERPARSSKVLGSSESVGSTPLDPTPRFSAPATLGPSVQDGQCR